MENTLNELEIISRVVTKPPYLMQGCGGSISIKTGEKLMVMSELKYHVKQGGENSRVAIINYENIRTYYSIVNMGLDIDFDRVCEILIRQNTIQQKKNRISHSTLEAGFHSLLDNYVIHTHSAYANILGCGESGEDLMYSIFSNMDLNCYWIPYSQPGFYTTILIKQAMERKINKNTPCRPNVFFLENHGLIVSSNDMEKTIDTTMMVNEVIKGYFRVDEKDIC